MIPRSKKGAVSENDLMMYLAVGLKHLRMIILLMCFSLLLGLAYYSFTRPVYYSISLVDYETLDRPMTDNSAFKDSSDRAVITGLLSPYLLERTARKLGINASAKSILKTHLKRNPKIRFDTDRNIVIEIWAYSYEAARDWSEAMVQEYLLDREEKRIARTESTIETFNKEMAELRARMDKNIEAKFEFRGTNEMMQIMIELNNLREIPRQLTVVEQELGMMDLTREILHEPNLNLIGKLSLLSDLNRKLASRVNIGETVQGKEGSIVVIPPMLAAGQQKSWEELDKEQRRLEQDYARLSKTFLPGHRSMMAVYKQLEEVNRSLALELEVGTNRFELDYANLVHTRQELRDKLPAVEEITKRHQKYLHEANNFEAGELSWQKMHSEMERRLNVLDYAPDKERAKLRYVGYLEEPRDYPISPHRLKLVIYSLLLGFALAIAVPFLIEYLDSRVSDVEQVEEALHLRGLGVVPKIADEDEGLFLTGDGKPDYHLQENFRVIRTNLIINSETASLPQVILVTSAMPQEGKTVVSSNLAVSFAMKGEKVLLIDADLRRGRLHRLFGAHNKPGLSDILRERKAVAEACRPTIHENLTLMTCGKHLNSASELLDSPAFSSLIEELRGKYERIIIDTPPVLGLAETSIIQRSADGILFVIWSDFTPIRNVKAAIQSLQTNGAKFAGFVLNRLDFHALGNRYKYFYYAPNYYTNYKAIEAPTT